MEESVWCTPGMIPENLSNSRFYKSSFNLQIWPFWDGLWLSPPLTFQQRPTHLRWKYTPEKFTWNPKIELWEMIFQTSLCVQVFLMVHTWLQTAHNLFSTCRHFWSKTSEFPFIGKVEIHREWHVSPFLQCSCSLPSTSGRNDTKLGNREVLCGEKELGIVKFSLWKSWGNPQPANLFWCKANHSS